MARKLQATEIAHARIGILRAIVRAERRRAEANPFDRRNIDLGIVDEDVPRDRVRERVKALFNEFEVLLDNLAVAHTAAAFEEAAKAKLNTAIGEARTAIERSRKGSARWPVNLVRSIDTFDGLRDIAAVLSLDPDEEASFRIIRDVRNRFGHSVQVRNPSAITSDEALDVLSGLLARMS